MHLRGRRPRPYNWGQRGRANRTIRKETRKMQTMKLIPLAIAAASLVVVVVMALSVPAQSALMAG